MKSILFIDLSFHRKTSSSSFLLEILSKEYEIERHYEEEDGLFHGKSVPDFGHQEYDIIIYWQKVKSLERVLGVVKAKSYCFFPMYDDSPVFDWHNDESVYYWGKLRNFRIICFCKALYDSLLTAGFDAHYFQFFPEPVHTTEKGALDAVYLWRRTSDVGLEIIEEFGKTYPITAVHCHDVPDPWMKDAPLMIPESLQGMTSVSTWYPKREDMLNDMERCALYMAPRIKEGIGMSFLEAMAMGRCVIAPKSPTMNEYIEDGKTGVLYELDKPEFYLTPSKVREIQERTREYTERGYQDWLQKQEVLLECIKITDGYQGTFSQRFLFLYLYVKRRIRRKILFWKHKIQVKCFDMFES